MESFIINVKYDVGYCDIDSLNILTSALQKTHEGWRNKIILNTNVNNTNVKNSNIELIAMDTCKYYDESYKVVYNLNEGKYVEMDNKEDIFNFVKECIERITYYSYRSVHSMDDKQRTDIEIISISEISE